MKQILHYLRQALIVFVVLGSATSRGQCWKEIACGSSHTLAIREDGTLWAWGNNFYGNLGNFSTNNSLIPIQIGVSNDWKTVYAGGQSSMAIKNDGTLWSWGHNYYGQLGIDVDIIEVGYFDFPQQVVSENTWKSISVGNYATLGIKDDGTLWGWGQSTVVLPGAEDYLILTPTQIGSANDWKEISVYSMCSFGIKNNGTLWAWGNGSIFGELGAGAILSYNAPTQIGISSDWKEISSGTYYNVALRNDGSLWAWGLNDEGQLGTGEPSNANVPVQVGTSLDWKTVKASANHAMALKNDNSFWVWGSNQAGQLGNANNPVNEYTPIQLGTEVDWKLTGSHSYAFTMALKESGELQSFGLNELGELGNGTTVNSNLPITVICENLNVDTTGKNVFTIYPNPTKEWIYIDNPANLNIDRINITDISGKNILSESGTDKINISQFTAGIYILQIRAADKLEQIKFIKL